MTGPTYLTISRMFLAILFAALTLLPETGAKIAAIIVFLLAALTDKIDGIWARRTKQVTDLGAFLDPLADKMLVDLAFLALTYLNVIPLWVFGAILIRDLAVDGMRMVSARKGETISASLLGKIKTTTQIIALAIILFNQILNFAPLEIIGNIVLYLALAMTVISGLDYLIKGYQKLNNTSNNK